MKHTSISNFFKNHELQYSDSQNTVNFNNTVIVKDINISERKNL